MCAVHESFAVKSVRGVDDEGWDERWSEGGTIATATEYASAKESFFAKKTAAAALVSAESRARPRRFPGGLYPIDGWIGGGVEGLGRGRAPRAGGGAIARRSLHARARKGRACAGTPDRDRAWGGARTSAPRVAKLAERMEGDTMTEFLSHASTLALAETLNAALALTAERLEATCAPARALRAKTAELAEMADIVRTECVE